MAVAPKLFLTPSDRMVLDLSFGQEKPRSKFDGLIGRARVDAESDLIAAASSGWK
jgi:hypothetical protein